MRSIIKNPLKHRGLFLRVGFVVALGLVILAFQWKTYYTPSASKGYNPPIEEQMRPIRTKQVAKKKQVPKAKPDVPELQRKQTTTQIKVVNQKPVVHNKPEVSKLSFDKMIDSTAFDTNPLEEDQQAPRFGANIMPSFPGGQQAIREFISKHIKYPDHERELGIEGTVHVKFVVDQDGNVTQVEAVKGPTKAMREEAERVIRMLPQWNPARHNGRNVPVFYFQPINFKLDR